MSSNQKYTCGAVVAIALLLSAPAYSQSDDDESTPEPTETVTVAECTDEWEDSTAYDSCGSKIDGFLDATIEVTSDAECSISVGCAVSYRVDGRLSWRSGGMEVTEELDDVSDLVLCLPGSGPIYLATSC